MSKTILLLSTALLMSATAASAAPSFPVRLPNGVVLSKNANGVVVAQNLSQSSHGTQSGSHAPINTSSISSLWSKEKNAPYIPWFSAFVGCYSGFCESQAVAFTPAASTTSKRVTMGLMAIFPSAYPYQADISIYTDAGGLPGTAIATQTVTATTTVGLCCTAVTAKLKAPLTAGTQYWLVAVGHTSSDVVGWGLEDEDFKDDFTYAVNEGSGWAAYSGNQIPAYELK